MQDIKNIKVSMGIIVLGGFLLSAVAFGWKGGVWYSNLMQEQRNNTTLILDKIADLKSQRLQDSIRQAGIDQEQYTLIKAIR